MILQFWRKKYFTVFVRKYDIVVLLGTHDTMVLVEKK